MTGRTQRIGQISSPGGRPHNFRIIDDVVPVLTEAERAAGIQWVDGNYLPSNVKRYGAVGDGVADDTVAIQAAIDVSARSKCEVFIPAGTYLFTSLTVVNTSTVKYDGLIIRGEGTGLNNLGTVLTCAATSGVAITFSAESSSSSFLDRVRLKDIGLRLTGASTTASLLRIVRVYDISLENIYLEGNNASETLIDGNEWVVVHFRDCYFRDASVGVDSGTTISGFSSFANVIKFEDCLFDDLTTATDFSDNGRSVLFDHCTWEPTEAGAASANLTGSYNTYFKNCWMGDADGTGTWITAEGEQLSIEDSEIIAGAISVDVQTTFSTTIRGGRMEGATSNIRIEANNVTVKRVRLFAAADNCRCIDVVAGSDHVLDGNTCSESGTRTATVGYYLASGTTGYIRDRSGVSSVDTLVSNNTTGGWDVQTRNDRRDGVTTTNVASIAAGAVATFNITVPAAETDDLVILGFPSGIDANLLWCAHVSATDTVTVRLYNPTGAAIDPGSLDYHCRVLPPEV